LKTYKTDGKLAKLKMIFVTLINIHTPVGFAVEHVQILRG